MPAPTTADELLGLITKSGLVEEARLKAYLQKLGETSSVPTDTAKLAAVLVRDAMLTYFQAEQLLQGKYKRFSLGKYKVLERLGSGGMGTVFLCEHKLMRRRVAVKVLPIPKAEDKASLDRFYREARAVAAVDHPNIVRAYDIDQDDNLHFLVMEWVDGTNLQDLVKKFGSLDVLRACHYIYGAAVGLQHAHEIGLIHRDIKPGNILIDRAGVVKILDMGLARFFHDQDDNLTRQNDESVLGTADYLAPEQALDSHTVDIRADIYSLGATFYYLLTGSAPFPEGSVAQKLIWHQSRAPRPIKVLRGDVPDQVVAVVEKMMAKEPAKRYKTPAEVMAVLAGWVATPIPPPAEHEMPTLSPAIAGGSGVRGSQAQTAGGAPASTGVFVRTMPGTGPSTMSGAATVVATAPAPTLPSVAPTGVSPGVWDTLDTDTQSAAQDNTGRPRRAAESEPNERPSRVMPRTEGGVKVWFYAAGGALLLALVSTVVYFAFFNKKPNDIVPPLEHSREIIVSKTGGANAVGSLREALKKATPGDTIVIVEPRLQEPVLRLDKNQHKDLTIESRTPDGKPAVIEFVGTKGGAMLDGSYTDGLRIKDIIFDGNNQAEIGIQLTGTCPKTTFENVTVRKVKKSGFNLWNLAGEAGRPVTLERVRVILLPTAEAGVVSLASPGLDNKYIVIKNSRFEGPGRAGVRIEGVVTDLELSHNRFFHLTNAVSFAPQPGRPPSKGRIKNNTFCQVQNGLLFEIPPPPKDPKAPKDDSRYEFEVALNYFAQTLAMLNSPVPVPGLTSADNLHDAASLQGAIPLTATRIDTPTLQSQKPDDPDDKFLRFAPGAAPTPGPNKPRVGAQ